MSVYTQHTSQTYCHTIICTCDLKEMCDGLVVGRIATKPPSLFCAIWWRRTHLLAATIMPFDCVPMAGSQVDSIPEGLLAAPR